MFGWVPKRQRWSGALDLPQFICVLVIITLAEFEKHSFKSADFYFSSAESQGQGLLS